MDIKLKKLTLQEEIEIVENIVNDSIDTSIEDIVSDVVRKLEAKYFKYNEVSYQYLSSSINLSSMLSQIENIDNLPKNVVWAKSITSFTVTNP